MTKQEAIEYYEGKYGKAPDRCYHFQISRTKANNWNMKMWYAANDFRNDDLEHHVVINDKGEEVFNSNPNYNLKPR